MKFHFETNLAKKISILFHFCMLFNQIVSLLIRMQSFCLNKCKMTIKIYSFAVENNTK